MREINIRDAAAQLSQLLDALEGGERVVITRDGQPVALLEPYRPLPVRPRKLGLFAGEVTIHRDFDELPAEMADALGATK